RLEQPRSAVGLSVGRLVAHGYAMLAEDQRLRSRIGELARELRYVKQRFRPDDANARPYLVRSLKMELRDRSKPNRDVKLTGVLEGMRHRFASKPEVLRALDGAAAMLAGQWGADPEIAGFQQRAFEEILSAWHGDGNPQIVISADTGSGKTEAACLPMITAAAADRFAGIAGTRAVIAYPRVRLAANQAQRLTKYLAALRQIDGMPLLTIGLQVAAVPRRFDRLHADDVARGWRSAAPGKLDFPFFGCPECEAPLLLEIAGGEQGADRLDCLGCGWRFGGWVGSKAGLMEAPPAFFLPTTDSLHQWMHNPDYGRIFGDEAGFAAPRALLADEIHLFSHIHGAQVGHAFRRLLHRAKVNSDGAAPLAIGMSATLGDPATAWGRLIGRDAVTAIRPLPGESDPNPRGREYFFFIQPEIESRGSDIAGASTTIQAVMCLAHGMRRRTGSAGGYRTLVFLDSIDKLRRMHSAFVDAEEEQNLFALRTERYPDDPVTGTPRRECCGQPHGCDRFEDGECWYFAATDRFQVTTQGSIQPGSPLHVANQPISSATEGKVDALIKSSDILFATSSLEVGFDDPDMTMVFQHYAPQNLASFIQRKGRGGRGIDDRPMTGVTLSLYARRGSPHPRVAGCPCLGAPASVRHDQLARTLRADRRCGRRQARGHNARAGRDRAGQCHAALSSERSLLAAARLWARAVAQRTGFRVGRPLGLSGGCRGAARRTADRRARTHRQAAPPRVRPPARGQPRKTRLLRRRRLADTLDLRSHGRRAGHSPLGGPAGSAAPDLA
ncbi:MAG: DEAD/DEAH box helicase, partial [Sphingobium sp.]